VPARGLFISFEGGEGSGKSTQIQLLAEKLNAADIPNIVTREPGGTVLAEKIRELILLIPPLEKGRDGWGSADKVSAPSASGADAPNPHLDSPFQGEGYMDALTETLLFAAARNHHISQVIKPALAEGKIVLCDRFLDSTRVYQGIVKGLGQDWIDMLHHLTFGHFLPDLTLLLDIDSQTSLRRARTRIENQTKYENEGVTFHKQIHEAFLALAKAEPQRIQVIDASKTADDIAKKIWDSLQHIMKARA